MDFIKKYWPFSFNTEDVKQLVIKAIIYVVIDIVLGTLIGLLARVDIAILSAIFTILGSLLALYVTAGLVFLFLSYFKVLKD